MIETKNMVRWTNEERALLAHFVKIGVEMNKLTIKEACEFASKKLGRSLPACEWQYQNYIKAGKVKPMSESDFVSNEELINTDEQLEIDYLKTELLKAKAEKTELMSNMSNLLTNLENTFNHIQKNTTGLTETDIIYNINLVRRTLIGKL